MLPTNMLQKLRTVSMSTFQPVSGFLFKKVSEKVYKISIGINGCVLVFLYLCLTGIAVAKMANGFLLTKHNTTFIEDRPVVNDCSDVGLNVNLTSICNPCDTERIKLCSIGCADSDYANRKEKFYSEGDFPDKHFETDFYKCHPFWRNSTVRLVEVVHSKWGTGLVITTCIVASTLNLVLLGFGIKKWMTEGIYENALKLSERPGLKHIYNSVAIVVWVIKNGGGHMFAAVGDSLMG